MVTTATQKLLPLIESYLEYYTSGSGHTARAKRTDLKKFLTFLQGHYSYSKQEKLKLNEWNNAVTHRFVEESLDIESPATVARRLATLKHCGKTLSEQITGFKNPAKEVKTPKLQQGIPKALEPATIKKIKKKALERIDAKNTFIRYRNQVLFYFLLETGLRAEEVRLVKISQLDPELKWLKSVRTKGKRYRNVYLSSSLEDIMSEYIEVRQNELIKYLGKYPKQIDQQLPIFVSFYKADIETPKSFLMGAKTLWRAINELSTEVELHPHLLRHTFALDLLRSSGDVRLVSQALGHGDVKITMRYTERSDQEVAKAIEAKTK